MGALYKRIDVETSWGNRESERGAKVVRWNKQRLQTTEMQS
jgi:hypothetical protein